jgi:hypothetical protein
MTIEVVRTCPLGSKCEEVKDGKIQRCAWYVPIQGPHPQTGEQMDKFDCSMAWMPLLTLEVSKWTYSTGGAVESFRNQMMEANKASAQMLLAAMGEPH